MDNQDRPMLTRELAAYAITSYFLANAEAGNHAANDELIAELARRRQSVTSPGVLRRLPDR